MMKKRYAMIMTAAMLSGIMTATAMAEGPGMENGMQMSGPQMPGGSETGQMPQMNGEAPQANDQQAAENGEAGANTQTPENNGTVQQPPMEGMNGAAPQGQAPQANDQQASENGEAGANTQTPENNGAVQQPPMEGMNGKAPQGQKPQMGRGQGSQNGGNGRGLQMGRGGAKENFGFVPFENYVKDGTISQETYDAIKKYMDENKPELPEERKEGEQPELSEGTTNGTAAENDEQLKEGEGPDLLKDLLEAGVITQEEYDTLNKARTEAKPEQAVNGESKPAAEGVSAGTASTDAVSTDAAATDASSTDTSSTKTTGNE